jgi:hypothetical protein
MSFQIEVIIRFESLNYKVLHFNIFSSQLEEDFILKIFERLTVEELNQLEAISCCQFCDDENDVLPFLKNNNGKYYFNDDEDPLSLKAIRLREEMLNHRTF